MTLRIPLHAEKGPLLTLTDVTQMEVAPNGYLYFELPGLRLAQEDEVFLAAGIEEVERVEGEHLYRLRPELWKRVEVTR